MKLQIAILLILTCGVFASAQSQEKCFELGALKDRHVFRFETDGGDAAGSYSVEREYDAEQTETYDFSGTRSGNTLTVKFAKYAKLQGHPFEINRAVLTLVKFGDAEILKAKFYGKGSRAVDAMDFESCEPSFETLAKTAKRISFVKGANSATVPLLFKNERERKAFLLGGVRKGQTISVESHGCGIAFYYPDKTAYEEGAAIDDIEIVSPQAGDYLFVIKPAGEPGACSTIFKITN